MTAIVFAVAAVIIIAAFLYVLAAVIAESHSERDAVSAYFTELLITAEMQMQQEREAYIQERNSLLERIQRPEFTPPTPFAGPAIVSDEIQDDLHLVGTIKDTDSPPPPDEAA
jgi:hypothetical protein